MTNYYYLACQYMAETEIFDRHMTSKRSPFDKTSAWLTNREQVKMSVNYAKDFREKYRTIWHKINAEIEKHQFYTAQMWVDEWHRLNGLKDT